MRCTGKTIAVFIPTACLPAPQTLPQYVIVCVSVAGLSRPSAELEIPQANKYPEYFQFRFGAAP